MQIDFRRGSRLSKDLLPLFNSVASESREKYNKVINDSSLPISNELDWWAENVSSRNTYSCPLFHFICCIELTKELENTKQKIQTILVDSRELEKILSLNFSQFLCNTKILYKPHFIKRIKEVFLPLYYEWFMIHRLIRLVYTNLFFTKTKLRI